MKRSDTTDMFADDSVVRFQSMLDSFWTTYGRTDHTESDNVLGTLIRTILAQATNRDNRERAFAELLDTFSGDWSLVAAADIDDIAAAIRIGGLAKQKAPRIRNVLARVFEKFGSYSLEELAEWDVSDAIDFLEALPGVGPKTAAFALMWSVGADTLAMNTDIFRVLRRTGFLDRESDKKAHRKIQAWVPDDASYATHMVLIAHGRETCLTRTPLCDICAISTTCEKNGVSL